MNPRPSAQARGYTKRWQKARATYLKANPWCVMCRQEGRRTKAEHVDHITPHRGDPVLFWNKVNWTGLCPSHHNGAKQSYEKTGRMRGCDVSGQPLERSHHWNQVKP